ncbi:MAG: PTS sugar transporter subunit IIA [Deltaproteobacteria bacterium]|nr:PTS sugar transporter subunit IIA [Deltaproteobacteria bacterium]
MRFEVFYMQILCLGLLVLAAHFGAKITRRMHVGEVVGQVLGGLVVGPILLLALENKFPAYREAMTSLHFFTFVFLSIIAFGIGDELSIDKLRKVGHDAIIMSLVEASITWMLITGTFFLLGFKPIVALIIGSIGIATAPAVTFVIMNKLEITGKMRSMLGGMVVLDDVIEVIIFSVMCQAALLFQRQESVSIGEIFLPVTKEFVLAVLLGLVVFIALRFLVERKWLRPKSKDANFDADLGPEFLSRLISEMPGPSVEVLIIVAGCVSLGVGLALHWHLPFLITAVASGIFIANLYTTEVFKSLRIENTTSMYTLVFFALIGANAKIESFHLENFLFIAAYIAARGFGKIGGTWLGCKITRQKKRLTQCLPKLMLPQAGVAAVEAYFVASVLGKDGETILSIILPALILFEIIGVLVSERTLLKWRSWITGGGELIDEEEIIREKLEKEKLNVAAILNPDCLRIPLEVNSKGEAIWELIRTLKATGYIENPGQILEIILKRERQGGTTLGDGIAILHGRLSGITKPGVALGVLPRDHGIAFGGTGDVPVDIIFMVVSPEKTPELHLQILAAIAKLLSNHDARTRLRYAKDETEVLRIIKEHS